MRYSLLLFLAIFLFLGSSCQKSGSGSGTVTIDNTLYGTTSYYALGFKFSTGKKVSTLSGNTDLTVAAGSLTSGGPVVAYLASNTFEPAFHLYGGYTNSAEAENSFNSLLSFDVSTWSDFGTPLTSNQVWIFRTDDGNYAKLLVTAVTLNSGIIPPFASCTFRWVYQPDGTTTFPE